MTQETTNKMANLTPEQNFSAPLPAAEIEFWNRVVAVYMGVLPVLERDLQKVGDLSFFEFQVLEHLSSVEGSMTMTQLGNRCHSSLSRLSHVARKLEGRDLLTRRLSDFDKRVTVAELTSQGRHVVERARGVYHNAIEGRIFETLTLDEMAYATELMDTVLRGNDPEHWLLLRGMR